MSEEAIRLPALPEPAAWLVTGGRTFVDRAYLTEAHAEQSIVDRKDGARLVALSTADQMQEYARAAVLAERERCARLAESDEFYGTVIPVAIAAAIRKGA